MKRFILLLFVMAGVLSAAAQTTLIATLSHNGSISTYYGVGALKDAYAAAVNGDLITLSSGQFLACDIAKAVTLRGAGFEADSNTGRQPTFIMGDFSILPPADETSETLTIEGIYSNFNIKYGDNLKGAKLIKDRIKYIKAENEGRNCSLTIINCRVTEEFRLGSESQATCINSIIKYPENWGKENSNFEFVNCMLLDACCSVISSSFTNCCLFMNPNYYRLDESNSANNCIGANCSYGYNIFDFIPNLNNRIVDTDVFESYSDNVDDGINYRLTDEAAQLYLGADGTQVGIYGGLLPFSSTPNNPQITKFKVAEKSTADGKLSIDITVSVPE